MYTCMFVCYVTSCIHTHAHAHAHAHTHTHTYTRTYLYGVHYCYKHVMSKNTRMLHPTFVHIKMAVKLT